MYAIAFALLLISAPAWAVELEFSVGRSEFCCLQDGIWWQSDFGFNGRVRSPSWEIGARRRFGDFSFHAAYLDLGTATGFNVATMRDDDFGRFDRTKGCTANSQKNCLGYFSTSQHVAGVLLGGAYGRKVSGVTLEAELGQYLYQSDMKVSILCPDCGLATRYAFGAGGTFSSASNLRRTNYIAIKVEYRGVFLTYRRFTNVDGNGNNNDSIEGQFATGLTNGPVNQIMFGVSM